MDNQTTQRGFDKKTVRYLLIAVAAVVVVILVGIFVNKLGDAPDIDQASRDNVETPSTRSIDFDDVGRLMKMTNNAFPARFHNFLTELLFSDEEKSAVEQNSNDVDKYTISIEGSSVLPGRFFPYDTVSMLGQVPDGRIYRFDLAFDGNYYFGLAVSRMIPTGGTPHLCIVFNNQVDTGSYEIDAVTRSLIDWAKSIYPDGVIVTVKE